MGDFKEDIEIIEQIIKSKNVVPEGCCVYNHLTFQINSAFLNKQINLMNCSKGAEKICEIGFNAGHSALLLASGSRDTLKEFVCFDLMYHSYVKPCYEYVKDKFPSINFRLIEGDSRFQLSKWLTKHMDYAQTFDVVHVDGGHNDSCFFTDLAISTLLCKKGGKIIIDDTNDPMINSFVDTMVFSDNYTEIPILKTYGYEHRIVEKLF
jgi:predicted O-methyltransferase YrrM